MFPVSEFAPWVDAPDHQGGHQMRENKDTGLEAAVKGVVEDVKGKVKEAAGAVTGKDELPRGQSTTGQGGG